MKKTYYLFNPGRMSRKDNTLKFTPVDESGKEGQPRYIPVEGVSGYISLAAWMPIALCTITWANNRLPYTF